MRTRTLGDTGLVDRDGRLATLDELTAVGERGGERALIGFGVRAQSVHDFARLELALAAQLLRLVTRRRTHILRVGRSRELRAI